MADLTVQDMLPEESGFDDFEGPVVEAYFELPGQQYMDKGGAPNPMLIMRVDASGFAEPVKLGGFSCGGSKDGVQEKWEITDGGRTLTAIKGKNVFHGKAIAGIVVKELYKVAGGGDINKGAELFAKRGNPMTTSAFWLGIESHWVKKNVPNPVDNTKTMSVQVPTDYVRFVEVKASAVPSTPVAAAKGTTLSEETVAKLIEVAKGKTERQVKMILAKPDEFKGEDKLKDAVFNKGFLAQLVKEEKIGVGPDGKYF